MATNPPEDAAKSSEVAAQLQADVFVQDKPVHLHEITSPGAANVRVERDSEGETDSAYEDSVASETTTVSSSVFSYTYANGRRYHSDRFRKADYFLPNDDAEQDRLDMYHHIFLLMLGGDLHIAPLHKPQRVLDVGTGTGIWAIEMAHDNPQAEVIGTDISPIQPTMVPPNCKFEVDDMEELWTYPKNHFDYIHMRSLSGSFQDWDLMLKQAYDHLQPGGILEYQDYGFEGHFPDGRPIKGSGTPMARLLELEIIASEKLGRPLHIAPTIKNRMIAAGFEDVYEKVAVWPLGEWPKDRTLKIIGRWTRVGGIDSLDAFAIPMLTRGHEWPLSKAKELIAEVANDLKKSSPNKYYFEGWFVWGRKPQKKSKEGREK